MKNIKLTILGVATLLFVLTLNFKHALNNYGILDNKLHMEVLAQSNTTDGGGSGSGGLDCRYNRNTGGCTITGSGTITVFGKEMIVGKGGLVFSDFEVTCSSGGSYACTPRDCAELWLGGNSSSSNGGSSGK